MKGSVSTSLLPFYTEAKLIQSWCCLLRWYTLCLQHSSLHSPVLIVAVVHVKGDHSEALANQSCVEPSPSRDKNRTTVWYTCVVTFTTTFLIYYITEQQRYIHSKEVHVFTIRGRHTSMPFLICGYACMHLPTS